MRPPEVERTEAGSLEVEDDKGGCRSRPLGNMLNFCRLQGLVHAPGNPNLFAGQVLGIVRGQIHRGRRNVVGLAYAAER